MALACVVQVGTVTIARGRQTVCARMDVLVMEFVKRRPASVIVILDGLVRDVKNKWTAQCLVIKRVVGTVCARWVFLLLLLFGFFLFLFFFFFFSSCVISLPPKENEMISSSSLRLTLCFPSSFSSALIPFFVPSPPFISLCDVSPNNLTTPPTTPTDPRTRSTVVATVVQVTKSILIVEHQTLVQEMTKVSCVIVMVCV